MAFEFSYTFSSRFLGRVRGYPDQLRDAAAESLFQINHYDTKSREEYERKARLNNCGYMAGKETTSRFDELNRKNNAREDTKILRFVPALQARLDVVAAE